MKSRSYIRENIIKNLFVIALAGIAYSYLSDTLSVIQPADMGNFLLIISILLVTVCFPLFAFTYEKSKMRISSSKILSHATTFIFMLLAALLLESMALVVSVIYPSLFGIILGFSVLLYLGIALYDFWDLSRAET